jgi:hypothetical protein
VKTHAGIRLDPDDEIEGRQGELCGRTAPATISDLPSDSAEQRARNRLNEALHYRGNYRERAQALIDADLATYNDFKDWPDVEMRGPLSFSPDDGTFSSYNRS